MTKKSTGRSWVTLKPPISAIKHSNYSQTPNSLHPKTMEDSTVSSLRLRILLLAKNVKNYSAKHYHIIVKYTLQSPLPAYKN
jgi:hypothetical protein